MHGISRGVAAALGSSSTESRCGEPEARTSRFAGTITAVLQADKTMPAYPERHARIRGSATVQNMERKWRLFSPAEKNGVRKRRFAYFAAPASPQCETISRRAPLKYPVRFASFCRELAFRFDRTWSRTAHHRAPASDPAQRRVRKRMRDASSVAVHRHGRVSLGACSRRRSGRAGARGAPDPLPSLFVNRRQGDAVMTALDPITLEVLRNAFISIAREMKTTIVKTAYSSTVQEAQDFSVALFCGPEMVAQAEGVAAHLAAFPYRVGKVLERFGDDLHEGDVVLFNDPYAGGSHTPDVTVLTPVRVGDLLFLPFTLAHWSDVGGMAPGSITGAANDILQEGLLIPPIKLYDRGRLNAAVYELVLNNVRLPEQRAGDIRAQIAACNIAADRLHRLCERYGASTLAQSVRDILDTTERRTRSLIRELPDGIFEFEDYIDSDGQTPEPYLIHARTEKSGDQIHIDFTGTSEQARGPTNTPLASLQSGAFIALKCMLDPEWPTNSGFFRPIRVTSPIGTCVNPLPPAPTGSVWEVCSRIVDVVMGTLCDIVPRPAGSANGSISHTFIGGVHPQTRRGYVWYEYPDGGLGATAGADGCDAMINMIGGDTKDFSIERAEAEFPLLCRRYALRTDSGGPGRYRGGMGLRRDMEVLDDGRFRPIGLSSIWDRSKIPTYGLTGGHAGYPQRLAVLRTNGETDVVSVELGSKVTLLPVGYGDVVSMRTGGGGGFGDPLDREAERVLADYQAGLISRRTLERIYGVVLATGDTIDEAATRAVRGKLRGERYHVLAHLRPERRRGRRRLASLHARDLERLGLAEGELVELFGRRAAPLRIWTEADPDCTAGEIGLDVTALAMLGGETGMQVWMRDPLWMRAELREEGT
ncbi:MAG: hydantoinase B/oxoprolinase family protein [Gammaproteobacteria bacterium]|nr:hydantoinase B/oxoprolinase family protein [Gammaproteobacteria bacterium]